MDILNKIETPEKGTQFLAKSHFKIGHEPKWLASKNPAAYRSTFKNDYPPQPLGNKDDVKQLPPAQIMHKDTRIGDHHLSVTRDHYGPKELSRTSYQNMPYALSTTNFKMDADEKIKSFKTTHDDYYYEKSLKEAKNVSSIKDWTKSHIPKGDEEKIKWDQSCYKTHFVPFGVKLEPIKHKGTFEGPPTIKGDIRIHNDSLYGTTTKEFFPSKYQRQIQVDESIRYPATHIPQGDRQKCNYSLSTQQQDFTAPNGGVQKSDRSKALKKLQSTSFKMGDQRLDSFHTTVQDSFKDVSGEGRVKNIKVNMSKSNVPEGDADYFKNLERFSTTTNLSQFKPPPAEFHNPKVDGSKLRTASNVHLGGDNQLNAYNTTMNDNFKKVQSSCVKALGDVYSSSIPTDYYKELVSQPTYKTDYTSTDGASRIELNPVALSMLKRSNVNITDPSFKEFETTHRVTYTPKENRRGRSADTGKLQNSSVPLGTLTS